LIKIFDGFIYDTKKSQKIAKSKEFTDVAILGLRNHTFFDLILYKTKNAKYFITYKNKYWIDYSKSINYPDSGWTENFVIVTEKQAMNIFLSCEKHKRWGINKIFPNEYSTLKEA
jgi:hypothetical protein